MRIFTPFLLLFLLSALALRLNADVVDRVVASVNGSPILWSDVEEEVRSNALIEGKPPADITLEERNDALNRLIDNRLLDQQMRQADAVIVDADIQQQIDKLERDMRRQRKVGDNDEAWKQLLKQYGLSEGDVNERLRQQLGVLEFVELRFRPGAQPNQRQVQQYYDETFVPEMKKQHAAVPALASVQPKIQQILLEQHITKNMDEYLKIVRAGANIWRAQPFASMQQASEKK